ncbi:hypothetical protein [Hydrogenophaga sp. PAMC20947]|uniref:hypothetical protein n=1 Tax=Hydrogenophaga sp. PAMC20947 TaxID=2565558 RepID=UPI00109DC73F|nr:hypothetical protein [Hydrogenophaga sp. PAMC20947]QCB47236.1 hypothetical protein E5678_15100 [Hydrogenophaga sp. PAMC20947]
MKLCSLSTASLLALVSLVAAPANAAKLSDLKVIQDAAQTGMWTMESKGSPEGMQVPDSSQTVCATREEILSKFDHALAHSPEGESQQCPTKLTTNKASLGVATMTCPASKMVVGKNTINLPGMTLSAEFKKVGANRWSSKMANMVGTYTYQGAATAGCVNKR